MDPGRVDGSLVHEGGDGLPEYFPAAVGDEKRHDDSEPGIGRRPAPAHDEQAPQDRRGDQHVGAGVAGVSLEEHAVESLPGPILGPRHRHVDGHRTQEHGEGEGLQAGGRRIAEQSSDRGAHQLETGDGEKGDDGERAEYFELRVAVGMLLVRWSGRGFHRREADHVVERVHPGVGGVPQDRQGARSQSDPDLGDDHGEIGEEDSPQDPANGCVPVRSHRRDQRPVPGLSATPPAPGSAHSIQQKADRGPARSLRPRVLVAVVQARVAEADPHPDRQSQDARDNQKYEKSLVAHSSDLRVPLHRRLNM